MVLILDLISKMDLLQFALSFPKYLRSLTTRVLSSIFTILLVFVNILFGRSSDSEYKNNKTIYIQCILCTY